MSDTRDNATSDLYLAAYYKVANIPILDLERMKDGRVIFVFEDQPAHIFRDLKNQFFMDQAKVPALSYSQAIKALKRLVHNNR